MMLNSNYKIRLFFILLIATGGFSIVNAQKDNSPAPELPSSQINIPFRDVPVLEKAFMDIAPEDRKDGIPVGKLGIDGGDKEMILKMAKEVVNNKDSIFDSFLVVHKDKLIFESYYRRGRINHAHPQASATKSYTGLVLGRAIQLGYLTMDDLKKPVAGFLKDLDSSKFIKDAEKVTLYEALTMTTGLHLSEENRKMIRESTSLSKGQGAIQALFEYSDPITAESKAFSYSPGPGLVMQVLNVVVPGRAKDFIKKEFLDQLSITNYDWKTAPSGLPESGWRSSITSRDMVKIGLLAMNKGKWEGKQLIPEEFITKATSRINYSSDDDIYGGGKDVSKQGYGYFWWSGDLKVGNKSYFAASAQGGGGQYIILIRELDLIIVATGHNNRGNDVLQIVAEWVLPGFIE